MLSRIAASILLTQATLPFPDLDLRKDVTETDDFAYMLGPSKPVFNGKVVRVDWAPDGSVLAVQSPTPQGVDLLLWKRGGERASKVLSVADKSEVSVAGRYCWVWNTGNLEGNQPIFRIRTDTGRANEILDPGKDYAEVVAVGNGESALITTISTDAKRLRAFAVSGERLNEIPLPTNVRSLEARDVDGKAIMYVGDDTTGDFYSVDLANAKLGGKVEGNTFSEQPRDVADKVLKVANTDGARIPAYWMTVTRLRHKTIGNRAVLMEEKNGKLMPELAYRNAFIGADARGVEIAANISNLAYWTRDNLFVRKIEKMSMFEFSRIYDAWEQKALTEQAKQVSIATQIYMSDYDDVFPPALGNFDMLFPYTKDSSVFDGFQYALNGQNATSIKDPDKTELGRINGRGGRAIIFTDGHVIWEKRSRG